MKILRMGNRASPFDFAPINAEVIIADFVPYVVSFFFSRQRLFEWDLYLISDMLNLPMMRACLLKALCIELKNNFQTLECL